MPAASEALARSCHVLGRAQYQLGRMEDAKASWRRSMALLLHPLAMPALPGAAAGPDRQSLRLASPECETDDEVTPRLLAVILLAVSVG